MRRFRSASLVSVRVLTGSFQVMVSGRQSLVLHPFPRRRRALVSTALLTDVLGTAHLMVSAEEGVGVKGSGNRTGDGVMVGLLEEGGPLTGSGGC